MVMKPAGGNINVLLSLKDTLFMNMIHENSHILSNSCSEWKRRNDPSSWHFETDKGDISTPKYLNTRTTLHSFLCIKPLNSKITELRANKMRKKQRKQRHQRKTAMIFLTQKKHVDQSLSKQFFISCLLPQICETWTFTVKQLTITVQDLLPKK